MSKYRHTEEPAQKPVANAVTKPGAGSVSPIKNAGAYQPNKTSGEVRNTVTKCERY
jgi:hypothetical protein